MDQACNPNYSGYTDLEDHRLILAREKPHETQSQPMGWHGGMHLSFSTTQEAQI
jgi:hypothetical protein